MLNKLKNKNQIIAKRRPGVIACLLFCGSKYILTSGFFFWLFYYKGEILWIRK